MWFGRVSSYIYKGKCISLTKKDQQLRVTNISNCVIALAVAFSKHWHVVVMQLLWRNYTVRQEAFLQTRMGSTESAAVFSLQGFLYRKKIWSSVLNTLRKIQFANNEHPLCSVLAKQLILVWDWSCATAKAVHLFCSEKYCNEEFQLRGFLSWDSGYDFFQFLSLHKTKCMESIIPVYWEIK